VAISLLVLVSMTGCSPRTYAPVPDGAELITVVGLLGSRYSLLAKEQIPGRLNAIVLKQFPDGSGVRLAFQIDCAGGPAWTNTTEAETLEALRGLPVGDGYLRTRATDHPDQQIAAWICRSGHSAPQGG
jgi:hypothetical protein